MGLVDSFIVSSCIGFTGQAQDACNKALLAGMRQSGIESTMNTMENNTSQKAENTARHYLGGTAVNYISASVFIAKSVASQSVSFGLPTLGLCNSFDVSIGASSSILNFGWKF